jgi:hypothetical protein
MRKALVALAVLAALAAGLILWWPSDERRSEPGSATGDPASTAATEAGGAGRPLTTSQASPEVVGPARLADGAFSITVTAGGAPQAHARVEAFRQGARDPNTGAIAWALAGRGQTDAAGRASILAAHGEYLLAARAPGFAPTRLEAVRPQGEAVTQVTLALEPGLDLSGRTTEKRNQDPVPLAQLTLTPGSPRTPDRAATAPAEEIATTQSDPRGAFTFSQVAPGMYFLEARAPGHAVYRQPLRVTRANPPLVVPLTAAGYLEGFVRTADGRPAAGAEVSAIGGREMPVVGLSGSQGGFSVEVEPGSWRLSAKLGTQAGNVEGLSVAAGSVTRGLSLMLGPGCVIEGDIQDRGAGGPVASARVDVSPHGFSGDSGRAVTGADGKFRIEGLPPGDYDVVVNAEGYGERSERANVIAGQSFSVSVALDGAGSVEGTVRDPAGHPLEGVLVVAGAQEARADADGHFRLDGVPAGRTWVRARRDANATGVGQGTEVKPAETAHLDLTLGETGHLQGHVRNASGASLDTHALRVTCSARARNTSSEVAFVPVDVDGTFQQDLVAGTYTCWAADGTNRGPRGFSEVTLEGGRTANAELVINDAAHGGLPGNVFEPDGTPSAQAQVTLRLAQAGSFSAQADDEGTFVLGTATDGDIDGPAEVFASNGGRVAHLTFDALPRQLSITLTPAGALHGRVVSQDGTPVTGFTVSVAYKSRQSPRMGGTLSGYRPFGGDTFELQDVPADALTVTVSTRDGRRGRTDVTTVSGTVTDVVVPLTPPSPPSP